MTPSSPDNGLLVWLGHPYFAEQLCDHGWRVIRMGYSPGEIHTWDSILTLTGGETPDAVLVADASVPPFVTGMEKYPCLTLFYVIDSHVQSWYPIYAQAFDLCLLTLSEHLPAFAKGRLDAARIWPTPPFARDTYNPPDPMPEKEWDLVFAGTMLRERAPKRYAFLSALRERFPGLHITGEPFAEIYPRARLVLNESGGELNFRVFEALSHGTCLLTPDIGPALTDIFTHERELFIYPPHDVDAVVALAKRLLTDAALRERVTAAGLAAVNAGHRGRHRAAELSRRLRELFASGLVPAMIQERRAKADTIHREFLRLLYLHHAESVESDRLRQIYLQAARAPL